MLTSFLTKVGSHMDSPSMYGASPLPLADADPENHLNQRVRYSMHGSNNMNYIKLPKQDFRILVLQDTSDLLTRGRMSVLYDSNLETQDPSQKKRYSSSERKDIDQAAHYLFGSIFQSELKQTSRIHCEPVEKSMSRGLLGKTFVIRTYHFDAAFERSLIEKKAKVGSSDTASFMKSSSSMKSSDTVNKLEHKSSQSEQSLIDASMSDISWNPRPATKIDHDFSSSNNLPVGICFILPFNMSEMSHIVGSNFQEFDKWLYEIQDLTLKYLKRFYHLHVEATESEAKFISKNGSKPRKLFVFEEPLRERIHFQRLLLQTCFQKEEIFLNYYHRVRIFLNTPRLLTGLANFENVTGCAVSRKSSSFSYSMPGSSICPMFNVLCKEIRNWMIIHEPSRYYPNRPSFLGTLLSLMYPLRKELVTSVPSDKRKRIVRIVIHEENEATVNTLMTIISCILPDIILKYEKLSAAQFKKSKKNIMKSRKHTPQKSDVSEVLKYVQSDIMYDSDDSNVLKSPSSTKRPDYFLERSNTGSSTKDVSPKEANHKDLISTPKPTSFSGNRFGLSISSPKAIPTNQAASVNSNAEIISVSENSSFGSSNLDNFDTFTSAKSSRSSSFLQDYEFGERRLSRNISIVDLTQKSIRGANNGFIQPKLFQRSPIVISKVNPNSLINSRMGSGGKSNSKIISIENPKKMKQEIYRIMYESEMNYSTNTKTGAIEVGVDNPENESNSEKESNDFEYFYDGAIQRIPELSERSQQLLVEVLGNIHDGSKIKSQEEEFGKIVVPVSNIYLPPIVGQVSNFLPEFTIQTVKNVVNKSCLINTLKEDLFHNQYIDTCASDNPCQKHVISTLLYVDIPAQEISRYEMVYEPMTEASHDYITPQQTATQDSASSSPISGSPLMSLSKDILNAAPEFFKQSTSSSASSTSSSSLRSTIPSTIQNLLDFHRGGSFAFEGKQFTIQNQKILDKKGNCIVTREKLEDMTYFLLSLGELADEK